MTDRTCTIDGCNNPHYAKGYCRTHYRRWRNTGTTELRTPQARYWAKVTKTDTCWIWTGAKNNKGYGQFWAEGRMRYAHRVAYTWIIGAIPEGMQLDHRCARRDCVNPGHLRPVTHKQNQEHRKGAPANSTSGIRGVRWRKDRRKWHAQVRHNGQDIYVGYFPTLAEADQAVRAKRAELFTHDDHAQWANPVTRSAP